MTIDEITSIAEIQSLAMHLECIAAFDAAPRETRKEFVLWVQANHPKLFPYLIRLFDSEPIEPLIYKNWNYQS